MSIDREFLDRLAKQRQNANAQGAMPEMMQMQSPALIQAQIEAQKHQQQMADTSFNVNVMLSIAQNDVLSKDGSTAAVELRKTAMVTLKQYLDNAISFAVPETAE